MHVICQELEAMTYNVLCALEPIKRFVVQSRGEAPRIFFSREMERESRVGVRPERKVVVHDGEREDCAGGHAPLTRTGRRRRLIGKCPTIQLMSQIRRTEEKEEKRERERRERNRESQRQNKRERERHVGGIM